jgi:hypothetical protein
MLLKQVEAFLKVLEVVVMALGFAIRGHDLMQQSGGRRGVGRGKGAPDTVPGSEKKRVDAHGSRFRNVGRDYRKRNPYAWRGGEGEADFVNETIAIPMFSG